MSWSLGNQTGTSASSANPILQDFNIGADGNILIVFIEADNPSGASGPVSFDGVGMQYVGGGSDGTHGNVQMHYLENPHTGTCQLSVGNTNGFTCVIEMASFVSSTGAGAFSRKNTGNGSSANPSINVTGTVANSLMAGIVIDGYRNQTTQGASYVSLHQRDAGNYTFCEEYDLDTGGAGTIAVNFVQATSDVWFIAAASFKEATASKQVNLHEAQISADGQPITVITPPPNLTVNLNPAQISAQGPQLSVNAPPLGTSVDLNAATLIASGKNLVLGVLPDTFNRTELGNFWTVGQGTCGITANQLTVSVAQAKLWRNDYTAPDDQFVEAKQYGSGWRGISCRVSGSGATITGYVAYISGVGASVSCRIGWHDGTTGFGEYLDTTGSFISCLSGHTLRLEATGQSPDILLTLLVDGVEVRQLAQANFSNPSAILTGGKAGIYFNTATPIIDDFNAGAVTQAISIDLITAQLAVVTPPITISLPAPDIQINLNAALLTSSGQPLTIQEGEVSIPLDAAQLSSNGQPLAVQKGAVSIPLDAATLVASGQIVGVNPGIAPITINLNAAQITANGQPLTVSAPPPGTSINLSAAVTTVSGQPLNVQPGVASIPLDAAQINAQGQPVTITSPAPSININLQAAQANAQGQPLDVQPGTVSISLNVAQIAIQGQPVSISSPVPITVNLQVARITSQANNVTISAPPPGSINVNLKVAQITSTGKSLGVQPGAVSISFNAAQINAQAQALNVQPGTASISLHVAQINANGKNVSISAPVAGIQVNLNSARITATGKPIIIQVGAVSVGLDTAIVNASGQPIAINPIPTPTPAACIPSGGGGFLKIRRDIVVILPVDNTKKKRKEEEEILIIP